MEGSRCPGGPRKEDYKHFMVDFQMSSTTFYAPGRVSAVVVI